MPADRWVRPALAGGRWPDPAGLFESNDARLLGPGDHAVLGAKPSRPRRAE